MLAVVDPYLLHVDEPRGIGLPARDTLADLVLLLARKGIAIPEDAGYWRALAHDFLAPLTHRIGSDPRYKQTLDQLRRAVRPVTLAEPRGRITLEGFDRMFDGLGTEWGQRMRRIVARCALTDETILLTRLLPARNARAHLHDGRVALVERLCWELRVRAGEATHRVACVGSSRNEQLRWTCRYAEELPAHEDGAAFPFCPPDDWHDSARPAFRAQRARPTWADRLGHFWAEPAAQQATGKSYHWDVYLSDTAASSYGLDQLNIARWRISFPRDGQPAPGALHHVPKDKEGRLKQRSGWDC